VLLCDITCVSCEFVSYGGGKEVDSPLCCCRCFHQVGIVGLRSSLHSVGVFVSVASFW